MLRFTFLIALCITSFTHGDLKVKPGIDQLVEQSLYLLKGKRVGILTNHTGINSRCRPTIELLKEKQEQGSYQVTALFAPEHGITGSKYAEQAVDNCIDPDGIPIYGLHGKNYRPTVKALETVDVIVYDIQDLGSRTYTYLNTLFLTMEEAAKKNVEVIVCDRPNPINGVVVDGPMVEKKHRSIIGYINIPYCHGMTAGELANLFNREEQIGCKLHIVPMTGWKREMTFDQTGLPWIPTSPHIPEAKTAFYYPMTGIIGSLKLVNTGVWYSTPFRLIGAPWIKGKQFADNLNSQNYPGVHFQPFHFSPYFGRYAKEECEGVYLIVTNPLTFKPVSTQFLILGMLKSLYPKQFQNAIKAAKEQEKSIARICGTDQVVHLITHSPYIAWPLRSLHEKERENFLALRKKYLNPQY